MREGPTTPPPEWDFYDEQNRERTVLAGQAASKKKVVDRGLDGGAPADPLCQLSCCLVRAYVNSEASQQASDPNIL